MSIVLQGSTSGSITLQEPAVAGTNTLSLPAVTATISTNVNGNLYPLTSGAVVASTSGTSIDFTGIPSWVKRITVIFNSVSTSGTSPVQVQLGDAGGIETTSYTALAGGGATGVVVTSSSTGFLIDNSSATAGSSRNGNMIITNVSANTWIYSGNQSDGTTRVIMFGGTKALSDVLTQLRVTTVGGTDTFDAGSINILYE